MALSVSGYLRLREMVAEEEMQASLVSRRPVRMESTFVVRVLCS